MTDTNFLDTVRDEVMRSSVRAARLVFGAYAVSLFLHLPESGTLSLQATSESDADHLLDMEIPEDSGIAGWVFSSGESQMISDVKSSFAFNADAARSTGYVPTTLIAVPLSYDNRTIGVMEVLDPGRDEGEVGMLRLAEEMANQCAASLSALLAVPGEVETSHTQVIERVVEGVQRLGLSERPSDFDALRAIDLVLRATEA